MVKGAGRGVGFGRGPRGGGCFLPLALRSKFLFLWTGNISGNRLLNDLGTGYITITDKDFTSRYLPYISEATFSVPDNSTYKDADGTDDFWFDSSDVLKNVTISDLIASSTEHTFVKYSDFDPFHIYAIGILKNGVTLTEAEKNTISSLFKLWIFYFGTLSDFGYYKDNRTID